MTITIKSYTVVNRQKSDCDPHQRRNRQGCLIEYRADTNTQTVFGKFFWGDNMKLNFNEWNIKKKIRESLAV